MGKTNSVTFQSSNTSDTISDNKKLWKNLASNQKKKIITSTALGVLGIAFGATLTGLFIEDAYKHSSPTHERSTVLSALGMTTALCSLVGSVLYSTCVRHGMDKELCLSQKA